MTFDEKLGKIKQLAIMFDGEFQCKPITTLLSYIQKLEAVTDLVEDKWWDDDDPNDIKIIGAIERLEQFRNE